MVILCEPVKVNKRDLSSVSEKSNINYTIGFIFKYFSVLQVVAGSTHSVDREHNQKKRKITDNRIGHVWCFLLKTLLPFMSDTTPHAEASMRKASHSARPQAQVCITEQLFLITHQYFISL